MARSRIASRIRSTQASVADRLDADDSGPPVGYGVDTDGDGRIDSIRSSVAERIRPRERAPVGYRPTKKSTSQRVRSRLKNIDTNRLRQQATAALDAVAVEGGAPVADSPSGREVVERAGKAGMIGAPMNATLEPLTAPGDGAANLVTGGQDGPPPVDDMLFGGSNPRGQASESGVDGLLRFEGVNTGGTADSFFEFGGAGVDSGRDSAGDDMQFDTSFFDGGEA